MLGATYLGDGYYYVTGNVNTLTGQAGTFVAGMSFGYMYQQAPDNYVDYIGSNGGTLLFRSQDNNGRVICYAGPSNSYRSIYSTCNFGAFRNGANTKLQLMAEYMEYLLQLIGTQETEDNAVDMLTLYPNPASRHATCGFTLNAGQHVTINIYDAAGRKVRDLANRGFEHGAHQVRWNGCDNTGKVVASGPYIFKIEAGNTAMTRTVVLVK